MKKKILIVDDSKTNLYMLETLLREEGFEVISAENGEDALDKAILTPPDLIVTDVLMPVMDGYVLCKQWKSNDALRHIPIVIYTATYTGTKNEEFALSLGADRFILKPQEPDVLMNILLEVLDEHYAAKQVAAKPLEEEMQFFKQYNEILFGKLEKKMAELETTNRELRRSEIKYRYLFDNASEAILVITGGMIKFANNAASLISGYPENALLLKPFTEFIHPEDREKVYGYYKKRIAGEEVPANYTFRIKTKDGSVKWVAIRVTLVDWEGSAATLNFLGDITEQKEAEDSLRESEIRYRAVFEDHSAVKLLIAPDTGIILEANKAAADYYGWSHEQLKQMKIQEISTLPPEDVKKEMDKALTKKQSYFEFRHRRADGSIRDVEVFSGKIEVKGKLFLHSIIHDITERKRTEEDLQKSEARFRGYFELPLIGMAITSPGKDWLEGNDRLSDMLGYSWLELKKMTWSELTYPEDLAAAVEKFNGLLKGEISSYMIDKRFVRKNGKIIWTSMAVGCVRKRDGAVDYLVALLDDITDRKEGVERLRKSLGATIQAMAVTVETRDPYTAGHQRRVADLARAIATEMGLTADQIDGIRMAAVIHDIGKLAVPAELLSMPRKLTEIEFNLIKTHSQSGYDILKDIEFPWPIARMVLEHHERMDGSGYPQGLAGDHILIESRILSVADVVEAMASYRPYRPGLGLDAALNEISGHKGTLYDPDAVAACLRLVLERNYKVID